ncbi:hypothetical protein D3C87_2113050 [compost metagenome]
MQRRQALVARADGIATFDLHVAQESYHRVVVQMFQLQFAYAPVMRSGDEDQKQAQAVAVTADSAGL